MSGDKTVSVSVTELVEFSARRGNLFDHYEGPTSAEGISAHRKIQKSRGNDWESEVSVEATRSIMDKVVCVRGRIDLLKIDLTGVIIEEIKTVLLDPSQLPAAKIELQLSQAKVYAALIYLANTFDTSNQSNANVHLTWYNVLSQTVSTERYHFEFSSLVEYLDSLIQIYLDWYIQYETQVKLSKTTAEALAFPFPEFRPHQREFSATVYNAIQTKQDCLFEAPTGVGKTISTLFPAIKAFGKEAIDQIIYLTSKVSTQQLALNTINTLTFQGLQTLFVVIQAKDRACPCLQEDTRPNAKPCRNEDGICTRTIGFYERLPEARLRCLNESNLSTDVLQKIANDFDLCPFELSLQMARWANIVIADVNYVYDPLVRLPMFKERGSQRSILIDEAHNLVERGRMMYSASLDSHDVLDIENLPDLNSTNKKQLKKLRKHITSLEVGSSILQDEGDTLAPIINDVEACIRCLTELSLLGPPSSSKMEQFDLLAKNESNLFAINDFVKKLIRFRSIYEIEKDCHVRCVSKSPQPKHRMVEIFCRDASDFLRALHKTARSTIGFSATLRPTNFFVDTLGFDDNTLRYSVPSSFPSEHQLTLLCTHIDTRFEKRLNSLPLLVNFISELYEHCEGNCLIFFPSYQYMEDAKNAFIELNPAIYTNIIQQERGSDQKTQHLFLENFKTRSQRTLGFAIAGGVFGEGIDFSGESLSAAVIVGTGMPPPSVYTKTLQEYFQQQGFPAFDYTYRYPGFIRLLQTAGRVIRSENDKGIVALVDPRITQNDYMQLMPLHWDPTKCRNESDVSNALVTFQAKLLSR